MTTDIRETLHDIGAAVAPPVIDLVTFDGRLRRARRARRLGQTAVAAAAVAVVGIGAWLVAPGGSGRPDVAGDGQRSEVPTRSRNVLAYVEQHKLFLSPPDDPSFEADTGIEVEEIVARVPDGVVYVDLDSHLKRVDVRIDGTVGEPVDVVGSEPIQWAAVDATATQLWFVDLDNTLHRRALGQQTDLETIELTPGQQVLAVGQDSWAADGVNSVELHVGKAFYDVRPASSPLRAALAGQVLAVTTQEGTEIWSTVGKRRYDALGLGTAALSPDGRWLASGADDADRDARLKGGLYLTDLGSGSTARVTFDRLDGPVIDIWWEDAERYFVVADAFGDGGVRRQLSECTADAGCLLRFEDTSGTLQLPRD